MILKDLTNNELQLQKLVLENKFESLKNEINKLCEEMSIVEKDYNEIDIEIKSRQNMFY